MMCWLFHNWDKWSRPVVVQGRYDSKAVQNRTCQRCGLIDSRTVEWSIGTGIENDD